MVERRNGQHPNHPNPDLTERAEQIAEVWDRRERGQSFASIAADMGMGKETARKLFREGYRMAAPPAAEEERLLMVRQYERFIGEIVTAIDDGEVEFEKGMHLLHKFLKGNRELLGLDAARKIDLTTREEDAEPPELAEIIEAARARRAEMEDKIRSAPRTGDVPVERPRTGSHGVSGGAGR